MTFLLLDEDASIKLKQAKWNELKNRLNGAVVKVVTLEVCVIFCDEI